MVFDKSFADRSVWSTLVPTDYGMYSTVTTETTDAGDRTGQSKKAVG